MILLKNVRCNFPSLFSFPEFNGVPAKAGTKIFLDKIEDEKYIQELMDAIKTLCEEHNEVIDKSTGKGRVLPLTRVFMSDGDETDNSAEDGFFTMNASAKKDTLPLVLAAGDPTRVITDPSEKPVIYSGCRVNVKLRPWWMKPGPSYQSRVNLELIAIQFAADDTPFSAGHVSQAAAMEGFESNADFKTAFD